MGPSHSGERLFTLKLLFYVLPVGGFMLGIAQFKATGGGPRFLLLLLLDIPILLGVAWLMRRVVDRLATRWAATALGIGNLAPSPSFSREEALIARGLYQQAAESFEAHLTAHPEDNEARLALARLAWIDLEDPARAEALYREVRRRQPTARQEAAASNQLIDLYRATGNTPRLKSELARFADRYPTTRAGQEARRLLRELKE